MKQPIKNIDWIAADLVDRVIAEWGQQKPNLDASGLGVVGRILRISHELEVRISKRLSSFNLSYSEFNVLATLRRTGAPYELAPKDLMGSALITSGAMTTLLDRLTERGFVQRGFSKHDGRVRTARLTKSGVSLVEDTIGLRFDEANEAVECFSKDEREDLSASLRKLANWLNTTE